MFRNRCNESSKTDAKHKCNKLVFRKLQRVIYIIYDLYFLLIIIKIRFERFLFWESSMKNSIKPLKKLHQKWNILVNKAKICIVIHHLQIVLTKNHCYSDIFRMESSTLDAKMFRKRCKTPYRKFRNRCKTCISE